MQQHIFPLGEFKEVAVRNKASMLALARRCYVTAGECDGEDALEEPWLQNYMLGKITEKMGDGPQVFIKYYTTVSSVHFI